MTDTADVVIIGGGVNGAAIAWALASRAGTRVVLCEQGALASGASGRSSALVRMHYTNETDARLAFASFPIFRHWTEVMSGAPPVFTHTGFVNTVAPRYADNLRKNVEMLRTLGVNTVALSPSELQALEPGTNVDDIGAAAYEPESGYANPADTVEGLRRRAVVAHGPSQNAPPVGRDQRPWPPRHLLGKARPSSNRGRPRGRRFQPRRRIESPARRGIQATIRYPGRITRTTDQGRTQPRGRLSSRPTARRFAASARLDRRSELQPVAL